jgi:hypothetical protein
LQAALERFTHRPSPEERAREALARAHARLRRFDAAEARRALDEARAAAGELSPTPEARQLAVQVSVQEAELALVQNDNAGGVRAMRLALAADPHLALDETRVAPPLVALLARARDELAHAHAVTLTVISQPPGARVWAGEAWRGETPLALELPEGPTLLWLARDDFRVHALAARATAGATLTATLEPLDPADRLRPLVDAVRQTAGAARREAALALAGAIGVDALLVVDAGSSPELYGRPRAAAAAPAPAPAVDVAAPAPRALSPAPRQPWYKKAWPWLLIAGGSAVAATAVGLGVRFGTSTINTITCCR